MDGRELFPSRPDEFLETCRKSSVAAYEACKGLLIGLELPETRSATRRFLAELEATIAKGMSSEERLTTYFMSMGQLPVGRHEKVTLLQLPSVFAPEEWSRTFFEGLARFPVSELANRTLAELGCGNGWVSICLGRRRAAPAKIYGLDVNPRAILCARINLYLNALNPDGELIQDADGKSLLDRVEFHESDLLAWVRRERIEVDRVIGCIPQVLNPDLNVFEKISDEASDEFLVSLSNYTGRQGYLEDQFGLGLIARALEEAIELMRPGGRVVLNLGGRPGREILHRLFRRRGFAVQELWATKIPQAVDTDIAALVEIEKKSAHRFEFFLGRRSAEPVGARTAQAYAAKGGVIYHSLTVFEGRLRFPEPTRQILRALQGERWSEARRALDLDEENESLAEEKAAFLVGLVDFLGKRQSFEYAATAGRPEFRRHVAEFLRRYFDVPLGDESIVVLPNRVSALRNILALFAPTLALIDPSLLQSSGLDRREGLLECPARADLACKLVDALQPQLVVTTLDEHEIRTPDSFLRLVEKTSRVGARLIVDISPYFDLQSTPKGNGVFQSLAEGPLPHHVAVLCGLVKNQVYPDLETCLLIAESQDFLEAVTNAAELTYSRSPLLSQEYYNTILSGLLSFRLDPQFQGDGPVVRRPIRETSHREGGPSLPDALAANCRRAFRHPAIAAEHLPMNRGTVRFDYGENALPSPSLVATSLFETFARRCFSTEEVDPTAELALFLRRRFGLGKGSGGAQHRSYGLGVAPLFTALAESAAAEGGTFLFPTGSYGHFVATVEMAGCCWKRIESKRESGFKVTPEELDQSLTGVARPWVFLNGPTVNPTGGIYNNDEVTALLEVAARHRARVVLDTIFSGLEHAGEIHWDLEATLAAHSVDLVVLGGISKELAAGGLRFGFAWCNRREMQRAVVHGFGSMTPHPTLLFAARRIFSGLNRPTARTRNELAEQRLVLGQRAEELARVLTECGWEPLPPQGGLFLVARPTAYLGRSCSVPTPEGEKRFDPLDSKNLSNAMFWAVNLLVNSSEWTGIDEYCRFAFALEEEEFRKGLQKIGEFRQLVLGG